MVNWIALLTVFGLALGVFLLVIIGMAVGVMLGRRRLSGSCGGIANRTTADGAQNCSLCSNSDNACHELARKMNAAKSSDARCDSDEHDQCQKECAVEGCTDEEIASCHDR